MGKYKEKIRRAAIDFFYKKMSSYSIKKNKKEVSFYYKKWKAANNGIIEPVTISHKMSKQILSTPKNLKKIHKLISSYEIPRRLEHFNPNECIGIKIIRGNVFLVTDSSFDTVRITINQFLNLNLSSKLCLPKKEKPHPKKRTNKQPIAK